jgi:hypothetical protein
MLVATNLARDTSRAPTPSQRGTRRDHAAPMRTEDLCALGANTMATKDLVAILAGGRDDEVIEAERALSLTGPPRDAALRSLHAGPRLLAAVELGRRAWMTPSPAGRRMRSPVDVAAVIAPRAEVDDGLWVLSLDVRLTLARVERTDAAPGNVLRSTLAAACRRMVVAIRRANRAVPDSADEDLALAIAGASAVVDVGLVDFVILGDDGFCSLARLGLLPACDARYR